MQRVKHVTSNYLCKYMHTKNSTSRNLMVPHILYFLYIELERKKLPFKKKKLFVLGSGKLHALLSQD